MKLNEFILKDLSISDQYKKLKTMKKVIVEEKESPSNINVLVLSSRADNKSKMFHTTKRIVDECIKRKIPNYVLFSDDGRLELTEDGGYIAYNIDDKKGFPIHSDNTIAINRGFALEKFNSRNIISRLEKRSIFCINNRETIEICADKFRTILRLTDAGVTTPKTVLIQGIDNLEDVVKQVGGKFPYILKTIFGSKGVGVIFIESMSSLKSILQLIWKINEKEELLLQEYIESDFDVRVHALGDEIIASMKRSKIKGDFRSNYSQGGKVSPYKLSEEEKEICVKSSKAVGASWVGVDFITKNNNVYVLEVNSSPGTAGIEEAIGDNIVGDMIDWAINKKNWIKVCKEIGYKEMVKINGLDLQAKFDTGNGYLCVIHADKHDIDEKNKTVTWSSHGKKFKNSYSEIGKISMGGSEDYIEERPEIELDMEFNGVVYKEVGFTLSDRSERSSPVLIGREFMSQANVSVNPARRYVITTKQETE